MRKGKVLVKVDREKVLMERRRGMFSGFVAVLIGLVVYIVYGNFILMVAGFIAGFLVVFSTSRFMVSLKESARIKDAESVFPDFLQLVASNLRAGMTVDRAMLLSARPEFAPLDREILQAGRDISTGKPIESSLKAMSKRIGSEKIDKTLLIILSGIRAGGDLAILLEETSRSMRKRGFVEKKAASQVLMYVIFIFMAVSIFAPGLFSLSGVLVETMTDLMGGVNPDSLPQNIPVSFSSVNISVSFIYYFSILFIIVMDIMASLVLGLVSNGEEKEGLRYLPIMLTLSLGIFFALGKILEGTVGGLMG